MFQKSAVFDGIIRKDTVSAKLFSFATFRRFWSPFPHRPGALRTIKPAVHHKFIPHAQVPLDYRAMRSLPVIDKETNRCETLAFACLGLVSLVLIVFATFNGGQFAAGQEDIIASLKKRPASIAVSNPRPAISPAVNGNTASRSALAAPQE